MSGIETNTNTSGVIRAITPSDGSDLPMQGCRAIRVGGAGDVSVIDLTGVTTVIPGALAGERLDVQAARVNLTGTTATGLIAFY